MIHTMSAANAGTSTMHAGLFFHTLILNNTLLSSSSPPNFTLPESSNILYLFLLSSDFILWRRICERQNVRWREPSPFRSFPPKIDDPWGCRRYYSLFALCHFLSLSHNVVSVSSCIRLSRMSYIIHRRLLELKFIVRTVGVQFNLCLFNGIYDCTFNPPRLL